MSAAPEIRNYMSTAVAAGFPPALVIPLVPPTPEDPSISSRFDGRYLGKTPAFAAADGTWFPLPGWRLHGCPDDRWGRSAQAGANAGIRTGVDVDGQGAFVFVDIDPPVGESEDDHVTKTARVFSDRVISALVAAFGSSLWVRRSRVGRAGVLFRIRVGGDPGTKVVYRFEHKGFVAPVKIEFLSTGQQVAAGGVHVSGHQLSWYRSDCPDQEWPLPPVAEIVEVASAEAVHEVLAGFCEQMQSLGIEVTKGRDRHQPVGVSEAEPAPSVDELVHLLDRLPNDHRVPREPADGFVNYLSVLFAVRGSSQYFVDEGDQDRVRTATLNWVCKYVGAHGEVNDWVKESEKWDLDFGRRDDVSIGWNYLVNAASELGDDTFRAHAAQAEFSKIMTPSQRPFPFPDEQKIAGEFSGPVDIWLGSDFAETAREIATVLARRNKIYDFGGRRSQVKTVAPGRVCVCTVGDADVPHLAAPVCRVLGKNKDGGAVQLTVPKDVRALVLSAPGDTCGVPELIGISAAPILNGDGSVRSVTGFDAATGLYGLPVPAMQIPAHPTRLQAEGALAKLRASIRTFPFADASMIDDAEAGVSVVNPDLPPGLAESAALVGLMTAICRPSLPLAPGFLVTAPVGSGSGAGKGLLVRVIAAVAYGIRPRAFTAGRTAEELDKRLGSELLDGDPICLLDNVNATALKSDTLASVLTESPARIRELGYSKMRTLSAKTFIAVTGNGLAPSEDLVRRFLVCDLDAKVENPSARQFKDGEAKLQENILQRRGDLLCAALTVWRWGRRQSNLPRGQALGSFETWASWCRDPLVALGCQDPVVQMSEARAMDPYRQQLVSNFELWWAAHGDAPMRATDVDDPVRAAIDPHGRTRQSFAAKLGQLRGTRGGGFLLDCVPGSPARKGGASYRLQWVGEGEAPPRLTEAIRPSVLRLVA